MVIDYYYLNVPFMKTIFFTAAMFASIMLYAQPVNVAKTTCANPVYLHAENIKTNAALLAWKKFDGNAVYFNLVWRLYGSTKWDSIFNIPDTNYLLKNLTPNTQYEFKVAAVCSDTSSKYRLRNVFSTLAKGGYCAAHSNSLSYIQSIRLKSRLITSGRDKKGYKDFTDTTFLLGANKSYTLYVKPFKTDIISDSITTSAYIDFNNSKSLSDAGELIGRQTSTGGTLLSFPFTVPAAAANALTRMRIIVEETYLAYNEPCNYTNGEAEDYSVKIINASVTDNQQLFAGEGLNKVSVSVMPNPVQHQAIVAYKLETNGNVKLILTDRSGAIVQLMEQGVKLKGSYNLSLNTSTIKPGSYVLALLQNNMVLARTTILIIR